MAYRYIFKKQGLSEAKYQTSDTNQSFLSHGALTLALLFAALCMALFVGPAMAQVSLNAGGVNGGAVIVGQADALACPGASDEYLGALRFLSSSGRVQACLSSGWQDF